MTSAPAATSPSRIDAIAASEGSPTVTYGISAVRPACLRFAKVTSMRFNAKLRESSARRIAFGPAMELEARALGDGVHVLVAASREIDQKNRIARKRRCELLCIRERVTRFECLDDPLDAATIVKRGERFGIVD